MKTSKVGLLMSLLAIMASDVGAEQPIIYIHRAIALRPSGMVALGTYEAAASIFLKIRNPTEDEVCGCATQNISIPVNCIKKGTINYGKELKRITIQTLNECYITCKMLNNCKMITYLNIKNICILRKSVTNGVGVRKKGETTEVNMDCANDLSADCRLEQLFKYTYENEVKEFWGEKYRIFMEMKGMKEGTRARGKRQALLLGMGIGGLLNAGFTMYSNKKLEEHINEVENEFEIFKVNTIKYQNQLQKSIVTVITNLENEMEQKLNSLSCRTNILAYNMLKEREITIWKAKMNELLTYTNMGQLEGPILPGIMTDDSLNELSKIPSLKNTIFEETPRWLLAVTTMSIISMTTTDEGAAYMFHIGLKIPVIAKNKVFSLFKVKQTSIYINGTCVKYDVPTAVYKKGDSYYKVDIEVCQGKYLKYCMQNSVGERTFATLPEQCLSKEEGGNKCPVKQSTCADQAIFTRSGAIIHTAKTIYGLLVNQKTRALEQINPTKSRVQYLPWAKYSLLQYDTGIIAGPEANSFTSAITHEDDALWHQVAETKVANLKLTNSAEFRKMMKLSHEVMEASAPLPKKGSTPWIIATMAVASMLFWVIWAVIELIKNKNMCLKVIRENIVKLVQYCVTEAHNEPEQNIQLEAPESTVKIETKPNASTPVEAEEMYPKSKPNQYTTHTYTSKLG